MMSSEPPVARIGSIWQQRIGSLREYDVVQDGNIFGANLLKGSLFSSEQAGAFHLLTSLQEDYFGRPFNEVFSGDETENEAGRSFVIRSRHPVNRNRIDPGKYLDAFIHDLTLVRGIGDVTGKRLNARGYRTLDDLSRHPRFQAAAAAVLRQIRNPVSSEVMELIGRRHSRSHPLAMGAASLHEPEDFLFLDIETLGLFSRPVILIGVGMIDGQHLEINQYLLREITEEPAALVAALSHLPDERPALVTYNGKAFDLPYLQDRLAYYGLGTINAAAHFDLLHFARARWRGRFPSLRLTSLEKELFGVERHGDVPGQMVPEFYETYQKTGNCGPLVPIVEHNRQDVLSLARLFFQLIGEMYGS